MKSKQIQIGKMHFKTLNQAKVFCQDLVARRKGGMAIEQRDLLLNLDKDWEFLMDLIQLHPHSGLKIGGGIRSFSIRKTPYNNFCLWIIRADGSETDFSWQKCFGVKSEESEIKQAMRVAIEGQIKTYRGKNTKPGQLCDWCHSAVAEHVDHVPPRTFESIADDFISGVKSGKIGENWGDQTLSYDAYEQDKSSKNEDLPKSNALYGQIKTPKNTEKISQILHSGVIDTYSGDGHFGRKIANLVVEKSWCDFHENQAVLRYLCVSCNLSDSKKEANLMKKSAKVSDTETTQN